MNKLDDTLATTDAKDFGATVRKATLRFSLIYWSCMFVADCVLGYVINIDPIESAPFRLMVFVSGALITYTISMLLFRMRKLSFTQKALLSILLTAIAAPLFAAIDFFGYTLCQYPTPVKFDPVYSGYFLIEGASMIFGWSTLFIALLYNYEVIERERRLSAVREEALTTQMRALRYQINPHFLFNTLNSIAGLIEEGAAKRAERMVMSLSNFMRTMLTMDPMHDIALADELALQEEYLEIERERFSDKMTFRIDMPAEVREALVPSLILQPLIENAIKHGVCNTSGNVDITLRAYRENSRLNIVVENDIPSVGERKDQPHGMGIGLRNVAQRLNARFQGDSEFSSGAVAPNLYRACINMPWSVV